MTYLLLTTTFSYLTAIAPRLDLVALKAMEAAATAWAAEKKKKKPVVEASQYELRRLKKGLRIELAGHKTARTEMPDQR